MSSPSAPLKVAAEKGAAERSAADAKAVSQERGIVWMLKERAVAWRLPQSHPAAAENEPKGESQMPQHQSAPPDVLQEVSSRALVRTRKKKKKSASSTKVLPFWQQASYYTALKDNRNVPGSLEVEDACDERESVKVDVEAGNCALGATTCCRSLLSGLVSLCTLSACFCALGLVRLAGWPVQNTCSHFETIQVPFL
jgi:hypothetical protein